MSRGWQRFWLAVMYLAGGAAVFGILAIVIRSAVISS